MIIQVLYVNGCSNECLFLFSEEDESSASEVLLAEVRRLEEALERIREDVQGLMGCRDKCEQLDSFSSSVSALCHLLSSMFAVSSFYT